MDRDAVKKKYAQERAKRLHPEGNAQYVRVDSQFAHYQDDPYVPVMAREPKRDHVTIAVIGGGFAGLVTGARLTEMGVTDLRIVEKGGDFGGTWYWNRYPGATCDTASMIYMPLLEETGYRPSEKYAGAPEILTHCQRIGRQYGLYANALFHTRVEQLEWDEGASVWNIHTDRGDCFTAQFVVMGTGPLHMPKLPGIPGIDDFQGHAFHTSRWDYEYTGGSPSGDRLHKLANRRVALIGTGATAVQCVPHLASACETLYVCQRTPSSVDLRFNEAIDPDWFAGVATPGWQSRWMENFTANMTGGSASEDLVHDGWTDISRRFQARLLSLPEAQRQNPLKMFAAFEDSDFEKMAEIRARVDAVVDDPVTADGLKAWYQQLCKRPCFHDQYLQAFNESSTVLLDTDGKGVERITESGVVVQGEEYPVDCIIYASGFEVGTALTDRCGFETVGRGGLTLTEYWSKGMRTLHGIGSHHFPNAFRLQPTQGANFIANIPHNIVESAKTIAMVISHTLDGGFNTVEVSKSAENDWLELLSASSPLLGSLECTPGYYNNEGQPAPEHAAMNVGYPAGAIAFFRYIDEWRESGLFEGFEFR